MNALFEKALRLKRMYTRYGQHTGTKYALDAARRGCADLPYSELDWDIGGYPILASAEFEEAPFSYMVEIRHEDWPDLSWIGEFGDKWRPGCIDISLADGGTYYGRWGQSEVDRQFFYPATEDGNLDWRFMKQILRDDLTPVWVHVLCLRNGIELGSASIGGCFYEYGKEDEVAPDYLEDLVAEATEEAESTLESLCPMA